MEQEEEKTPRVCPERACYGTGRGENTESLSRKSVLWDKKRRKHRESVPKERVKGQEEEKSSRVCPERAC